MPFCLRLCGATFVAGCLAVVCQAADKNAATFLDGAAAGPDFAVQGEYEGRSGKDSWLGAQVIALGEGKFDAVLFPGGLPGAGWDGKTKITLQGETKDGATKLSSEKYNGEIKAGRFEGKGDADASFQLKKVERRSPTTGAKPPEGALVLFDGTDVAQWENGKLEEGGLLGVGARTKQKFRNYRLHLEFRTPFMPTARGQGRGNSGMYLSDQYECQILDSFGLNGENNECGGIYTIAKPLVNMCLPPLAWQTYDVEVTGAKYDDSGKKIAPAVFTIRQNGVLIHDHLELPKNTPGGGVSDESQPGSLFVQDHGNPVRFRNIWIVEQK
jgi:hypothetical protein